MISIKLNHMQRFLIMLFCFLFFASNVFTQADKSTVFLIGFYKVEDGMQSEYEAVMTGYFGNIMKEKVAKGCFQNWIFRRVLPHTNAANYYTHMTIDVLNPGKTNYECDEVTDVSVFPSMSIGMHELMYNVRDRSRKVVYRTEVTYITGFNKAKQPPRYSAFNFMRTEPGRTDDFKDMHTMYTKDIFLNNDKQIAWHALERTDPAVTGSQEWNYMTIDGFETMNQKRNSVMIIPDNISKDVQDKYGNWEEMRDFRYQVVSELIMSAK